MTECFVDDLEKLERVYIDGNQVPFRVFRGKGDLEKLERVYIDASTSI